MFKFNRKKNQEKLKEKQNDEETERISKLVEDSMRRMLNFKESLENDFGELLEEDKYASIKDEYSDFFGKIYAQNENLRDSLIVAAFIREIEPTLEDIKNVYKVDDKYVDEVLTNNLPIVRQLAYKNMEHDRTHGPMFFEDLKGMHQEYYKELTNRIEYFFEIRRNNKKIAKEIHDENLLKILKNSYEMNYLLNFFSVKDSLLIAYELDLIDLGNFDIKDIYDYDQEYIDSLLKENAPIIIKDLDERIANADNENGFNYFDYDKLAEMYIDIENRIEDTLEYLDSKKRA